MAYVDTSKWDPADLRAIEMAGVEWGNAYKDNDEAGMERAHEAAELIRAKYGYTGGADGSNLHLLLDPGNTATNGVTQQPAQTQQVGGTTVAKPSQNTTAQAQQLAFTYDVAAPTIPTSYTDRQPAIEAMLNQLMNYGPFSYSAESDPTFHQYKDTYTREGQRAMQNTLAQVSARTGGLASSYALSAAQQANNYYMQQLSDKIPELRQLAYEMYIGDRDQLVQQTNMLYTAQQNDWNKYLDEMKLWQEGYDNAYGQWYDDREFNDRKEQNDYANKTAATATARQNVENLLSKNGTPDAQMLEAAGMSQEEADAFVDYYAGLKSASEKEAAKDELMSWLDEGVIRDDLLGTAGIDPKYAQAYLDQRKIASTPKYEPVLDADEVEAALKRGVVSDELLKAYKHYYGTDWVTPPEESKPWYDGMVDDGDYYTDTATGISHPKEIYGMDLQEYSDAAGNYQEVAALAADLYKKEGKTAVLNYLKEAHDTGALNTTDYSKLLMEYSGWNLSPR